jgi:hypothetical protein
MSLYGNVSKVEIASRETIPWLQAHLIGQ